MDVNEELKFFRKFTKEKFIIIFFFFFWGGGGGGHGRCEQRSEVFVNIKKKNSFFFFWGGGGAVGLVGGQGGCECNVGGRG